MTTTVRIDNDGPVRIVTIERPEVRNAVDEPTRRALAEAVALAKDLAALPQRCLRSDRRSAIEQWSLGWREAMLNEFHRGMTVIGSGESKDGATRFAAGAGRHGAKA